LEIPLDLNGNVAISYFAGLQEKAKAGMEGEIRMVARMDTDAQRTVYLEGVAEHRGRRAAAELRRKVWAWMKAEEVFRVEHEQQELFA
jgi:hypothetical protein